MMINPTKREMELYKKIDPWERFDAKTEEFYLIDGAPEEVKKAWKELKKIAEERSKNPFYRKCGQNYMNKNINKRSIIKSAFYYAKNWQLVPLKRG